MLLPGRVFRGGFLRLLPLNGGTKARGVVVRALSPSRPPQHLLDGFGGERAPTRWAPTNSADALAASVLARRREHPVARGPAHAVPADRAAAHEPRTLQECGDESR